MEKKIRSELLKMAVIMLVLAGLGVYAHEFVIAGIKAKMALNLSIFAIFGLAAWLAFSHVFALRNEVQALNALKVDYGAGSSRPIDPYRQPAIVFHEPELLGQGYRMISEELGKQEHLQISNSTVQALLHDVDQRIGDRKSTIIYFSGLMVFLGLLGAFMGLMKTVQSVGDLIGSMDVSGAGGTDSFGQLIEGMKGPLNGMSVGFSSSLFGLMTSMVLGALERCMTSAMKSLRDEYEHWLSNVAALENPSDVQHGEVNMEGVVEALKESGQQIDALCKSVESGARLTDDAQRAISQMAGVVTDLAHTVDRVIDPAPMLQPIATVVAELAQSQKAMVSQFETLFDMAQRDRLVIQRALESIEARDARQEPLSAGHLHHQLDQLLALQTELAEREPMVVGQTEPQADPARGRLAGLWRVLSGGPRESAARRESRKLRAESRRLMVTQRRFVRAVERSMGESVSRIENGQRAEHGLIARMLGNQAQTQAQIGMLIEQLQAAESRLQSAGADGGPLVAGVEDLKGARREIDMLRRRLNAIEAEEEAPAAAPEGCWRDHRATGTDNG